MAMSSPRSISGRCSSSIAIAKLARRSCSHRWRTRRPTGWLKPTPRGTFGGSSRSPIRKRSPATQSTRASTSWNQPTFDRIPSETTWSIERSYFPSLVDRRETFVAYIARGYWIDIGTPAQYRQLHHDIMDGRYTAPALRRPAGHRQQRVSPGPDRGGRGARGPLFHRRGLSRQDRGSSSDRTRSLGAGVGSDEGAVIDDSILWADTQIGPESSVRRSILGHSCRVGRGSVVGPDAVLGDESIVTDYGQDRREGLGVPRPSPPTPNRMTSAVNPDIFKAYDVRGLYPSDINEEIVRQIGRAFVVYLRAGRIAVSRDMRLSSPALAAAFIDGARTQGADVRKSSNNAVSHEKLNTETVPCKLSEGHRVFCTVVKSRLGHVEQWRGTYILTVNL